MAGANDVTMEDVGEPSSFGAPGTLATEPHDPDISLKGEKVQPEPKKVLSAEEWLAQKKGKAPEAKKVLSAEEWMAQKKRLPSDIAKETLGGDINKYKDVLQGGAEAVTIPLMGMVAKAAGGVASLPAMVGGAFSKDPGVTAVSAGMEVQKAFEDLIPEPKTATGKKVLDALGTIMEHGLNAAGLGAAEMEKVRAAITGTKAYPEEAAAVGRAGTEAATYFAPFLGAKAPKGAPKPSFGEQLLAADTAVKEKKVQETVDASFSKEVERMKAEAKKPSEKPVTKSEELPTQIEQIRQEQLKDMPTGEVFSPEYMEKMSVQKWQDQQAGDAAAMKMSPEQRIVAEEDMTAQRTPPKNQKEGDPVTEFRSIFSSDDMKNKFVNRAVATYGEEYRKSAEAHWDRLHEPSKVAKESGGSVGKEIEGLSDNLFKLSQQRSTDVIRTKQAVQALKPEVFKEASGEDIYMSMPEEGGAKLSPLQQSVKDTVVQPVLDSMQDTYKKIIEEQGGEVPDWIDPHTPRMIKETWLKKLESFGENMLGHAGYGKKPGTMKGRSMFAIEYGDGTRQVVNVDGRNVNRFQNGVPVHWDITDKALKPGMEVDIGGKSGKVVQATTKEIEAQTGIEYSKNLLANALASDLELKAYLRETKFLKETMNDLVANKRAIPADGPLPEGFMQLDHPVLRKYYIQDRFAEVFQDQILKSASPAKALERINTMAVSSMFWNPFPHLFNAFDHYLNSVNWDLVNPTQWGSIGKSMVDAYRNVSKLSPEYLEWIDSGAGGQYARVAAEGFSEGVMKQFKGPALEEALKGWGMRPDTFVADWYKTSKKYLWMGSDVFMLAANKHLASKAGKTIMDAELRKIVEAHNPNYRIPSRIGYEGMKETLDWATASKLPGMTEAISKATSRALSKAMQSRTFNIFGRYHYGQFRSIGHNVADLVKQSERSVQSRQEALKHLSFAMFNLTVVYPYIWDNLAQITSQDPTAKQRRSGAATIPQVLSDIIFKDESVLKILGDAYNLPPVTKAAAQMGTYEGRQKVAEHPLEAAVETVAPAKQIMDFATGKRTGKEIISEQVGIKLKSEEKERKKERAKRAKEKAARKKEAKRKPMRWED